MHQIPAEILAWVQLHVYLGTFIFMAMESSILPVPSEVVIPPAAYLAASSGNGIGMVIFIGTLGSWFGSTIMYVLSRWLGRVVIVKFGKVILITEDKLARAEHWLHRYEAGGIFFARLLPVVRHLISIPAGIIRMSFGMFSLMTVIGSGIWCTILAIFGDHVLGDYARQNPNWKTDPDAVRHLISAKSLPIFAGALALCVLYFVFIKLTAKRTAPPASTV